MNRFAQGSLVNACVSALAGALLLSGSATAADEPAPAIRWESNYAVAYRAAESQHKMFAIYFADEPTSDDAKSWEAELLASPEIRRGLNDTISLRVPLDYAVTDEDGNASQFLKHTCCAELHRQSGLAMIDFRDPEAAHYGRVVSLLPIPEARRPAIAQIAALLDLPPGSLTQRTMIWAIRIHPESPASTTGRFEPILATAAQSHSQHQADIRRQGHHQWESRFHRLNAQLGHGLIATEVCAESWPGESLVDAARECVRSWRQSPGHWNAVRTAATAYAYDLKRGSNGIWYATGIFGR